MFDLCFKKKRRKTSFRSAKVRKPDPTCKLRKNDVIRNVEKTNFGGSTKIEGGGPASPKGL